MRPFDRITLQVDRLWDEIRTGGARDRVLCRASASVVLNLRFILPQN